MKVADASTSFSLLSSARPLTFTPNLFPFTTFVTNFTVPKRRSGAPHHRPLVLFFLFLCTIGENPPQEVLGTLQCSHTLNVMAPLPSSPTTIQHQRLFLFLQLSSQLFFCDFHVLPAHHCLNSAISRRLDLFGRCACSDLKVLTGLTRPFFAVQHSTQRSLACLCPSSASGTSALDSSCYILDHGISATAFLPPEACQKRHPPQESSTHVARSHHSLEVCHKRQSPTENGGLVIHPLAPTTLPLHHSIHKKGLCTADFLATTKDQPACFSI